MADEMKTKSGMAEAADGAISAQKNPQARRVVIKKKAEASKREEKKRLREEEEARAAEEARREEFRARKEQSLSYADSFRQRQREEKEKRRALRERRLGSDSIGADDEAERMRLAGEAQSEAKSRNEHSDALVGEMNERIAEKKKRVVKIVKKQSSATQKETIQIQEEGRELAPAVMPQESEAPSETPRIEENINNAEAQGVPSLSSEDALERLLQRVKKVSTPDADNSVQASSAQSEADEAPIDLSLSIQGRELAAAVVPAEEPAKEEPLPESASADMPVVTEERVATPDGSTKIVRKTKKVKKVITHIIPAPKEEAKPVAAPVIQAAPAVEEKSVEDTALSRYLKGYNTTELLSMKADFGQDYEDAKKRIDEELRLNEDTGGGDVPTVPARLEGDYEYAPGYVYTYDSIGAVDKQRRKYEKRAGKLLNRKNKKRAKVGLAPITAGSVFTHYATAQESGDSDEEAGPLWGTDDFSNGIIDGNDLTGLALIAAYKERSRTENSDIPSDNISIHELEEQLRIQHESDMQAYRGLLDEKDAEYREEIEQLQSRIDELNRMQSTPAQSPDPDGLWAYQGLPYRDELVARTTDGTHSVTVSYSGLTPDYGQLPALDYTEGQNERDELASIAGQEQTLVNLTKLNRHELGRLLSRSAKQEEKLKKKLASYSKNSALDEIEILAGKMAVTRELLELYIADLSYCVGADSSKTKKYSRLVTNTAAEYNRLIRYFAEKTGTNPPTVDETIASYVINRQSCPRIPIIGYTSDKAVKSSTKLSPREKNELRREQLKFLKDDKRIRKEEKLGIRHTKQEPVVVTEKMVKSMMSDDLATAKARVAYRMSGISFELSLSEFHFNEGTGERRRERRDSSAKLRAMKRDRRALYKNTKDDNKRYAAVMNGVDISGVKHAAERERLVLLRQRIVSLINERDVINKSLMSIYCDNGEGKTNLRSRVANIRLKAAKKEYNKQIPIYKKSKKYYVSLKLKEEIWDLLNHCTDLAAYLAECKYRLRTERPVGEPKKWLKEEIRNTKKNIKYAKSDIYRLMRKAKRKNEKRPHTKAQFVSIILLMLLITATFLVIAYKDQLWALISSFINALTAPKQ